MGSRARRHPAPDNVDAMTLTEDLIALCHRDEPDPGPDPQKVAFTDAEFDAAAAKILTECGPGPVWVFAYGSLIWKPAWRPAQQCRATAHGWHRSFCLEMRRWRGSPARPGLMMGLREGGHCTGIAQQLDDDLRHSQLVRLLCREIDGPASLRWIDVDCDGRMLRALCFYAGPEGVARRAELPSEEVASILARACGHIGSGAEYLYKTVVALETHGIRDPHLWQLQHLVAAEIKRAALTLLVSETVPGR